FALRATNGDRAARWLLGASLAITAYVDYYYAVYGVLLVSLGALTPPLSVSFHEACGSRQWQRRVGAVLLLVLVIDVLVIATIAAVPVLLGAFRLWRGGDYVTQRYFWRSAPRGIDTATLLLGNPYGILTGSVATAAYRRLSIDPIEQIGWLGPGVIVLAAIGL